MRIHHKTMVPAYVALAALWLSSAVSAKGLPEFTALVETYGPAVVNISTKQSQSRSASPHRFAVPDLPEDSPLNEFFRRFFGEEGELPEDEIQARSLGSGFFVTADGYVLTNAHVVEGADEIIVRTSGRQEFLATVVGVDKRSDIALLKVEAQDLPVVKIGSAKDLKVGEWVLAIGSPFGFEHSATAGIVSAKGRSLPSENYIPFIQTDVAINPGNSGGPLFNLDGQVVGVNSQIYSRTGGFMGLSFAIPIDVVMDVVEQLRTKGRVTRGWLGVLIQDVTRELAETFGMTQPAGALVAQVLDDSPAEKAGLKAGDVILEFNGSPVPSSGALPPMVGSSPVGEPARVEVLRRGTRQVIELVIEELPEESELVTATGQNDRAKANRIGVVVEDLTAEERERLGIESGGVLVERVESGPAERAGILVGDIILTLDNNDVLNAEQFRETLEAIESGRSVAVLIQRGDGRIFVPLRIAEE
jgi:serine protease Do